MSRKTYTVKQVLEHLRNINSDDSDAGEDPDDDVVPADAFIQQVDSASEDSSISDNDEELLPLRTRLGKGK